MRSAAQIKGHPLHPMLVAFPIAFGVAAPVADSVGVIGEWATLWSAGAYLATAAVIGGLVAGVPGLIDYVSVVPPNSSASRRATWHLSVNLAALALIGAGWAFRHPDTLQPGTGTIVAEFIGLAVMTAGGWLGGTLVFRNQIGVDHRYAGAGKWKEATLTGKVGETIEVASADELKVGQMKLLHVNGRRVVLARTESGYSAFDDRCPHRGGSLADGVLACGTVTCPWHGSQFDARTGAVTAGPAEQSVQTYHVEEVGGRVRLVVPAG
ncbi:DUF2231 domain-containing protein [Gemmata sp. JC717]|uniref:DUF2231 domain-containing protein n=1 Tax=Gemmata algarum TaxID=2975278 RepID=UPI0021BAADC5|nr:DUF2231 domain-containing protein [Gemmata algarum]MDY3550962.1 DUF2231 domain-containing protein [Gemmata algarum]